MTNDLQNVPPQLRKSSERFIKEHGKGIGTKHGQKPVCVMLPQDIDKVVKAMPNRSEFIRTAIQEKLERQKEGDKSSFDSERVKEVRDNILMRQPPRERRKLQKVLDTFIAEIF